MAHHVKLDSYRALDREERSLRLDCLDADPLGVLNRLTLQTLQRGCGSFDGFLDLRLGVSVGKE